MRPNGNAESVGKQGLARYSVVMMGLAVTLLTLVVGTAPSELDVLAYGRRASSCGSR